MSSKLLVVVVQCVWLAVSGCLQQSFAGSVVWLKCDYGGTFQQTDANGVVFSNQQLAKSSIYFGFDHAHDRMFEYDAENGRVIPSIGWKIEAGLLTQQILVDSGTTTVTFISRSDMSYERIQRWGRGQMIVHARGLCSIVAGPPTTKF